MKAIDRTGPVAWFILNPVASKILLAIVIMVGITGLFGLRQEVFPPFAPNRVDMTMLVRGASPAEVELQVIRKIEQQLADLDGIERVVATAYQDRAQVQIELASDAEPAKMLTLIKSRVDGISSFPVYAERPAFNIPRTTGPFMLVNVSGELPVEVLHQQALTLVKALSLIPGISYAEIANEPEMQVSVEVPPQTLHSLQLSLADIARAIDAYSLNISVGDMETRDGVLSLRSDSLALSPQQFARIPIKALGNGVSLRLGEIAAVRVEPVKTYSISRFNGTPSLELALYRDSNTSLSRASEQVRRFLADYQQKLGDNLTVTAWKDDSREFTSRTSLLLSNGISGFIIICVLLGTFIHIRVALWTAFSIPVAMLGALGIMHLSGLDISLNAITLFGFLIAAGILVDDNLVIGESIYQQTKMHGHSPDSVIAGAKRVATPATLGALTSVAAFFPLTLTEGEIGSRMGGIGVVVICCLLASLLESKLILPSHLLRPGKKIRGTNWYSRYQQAANGWLENFTNTTYRKNLLRVLQKPWHLLATMAILFALSIFAISSGYIRTTVLPDIADYEIDGIFNINTNLSRAQREWVADRISASLEKTSDEIKQQFDLDYDPVMQHSMAINTETITLAVEIDHSENAPFDAHEVAAHWRGNIPQLTEITAAAIASGPGSDEQVALQLSSDNPLTLELAKEDLKKHLQGIDGVVDIRDTATVKSKTIRVDSTPQGEALGASQRWLSEQVRAAFYGIEAQRVQSGEREWRVMVSYPQEDRNDLADLMDMRVTMPGGEFVSLSLVGETRNSQTETKIIRIDSRQSVTVYANTLKGFDAESITETVAEEYMPLLAQQYTDLSFSIEGQAKEAAKSIVSLISAGMVALFVCFALMAIPMQSFRYTLLILAVLPLGLIGTVLGHLLIDIPYSLISMFGLIALMGVLINNGLLLIDAYRSKLDQGVEKTTAIVESCLRRFRPIVLTSATTFAGLMPLLWESDPEALWLVPIAVSLGIGVLAGTALTLLVLPVLLKLTPAEKGAGEVAKADRYQQQATLGS